MDDVSGFLAGSAEVFLPVIVVISLVAALATVAERYATRRQWSSAQRAAQVAIWSLVTLAIVAAATVPVGFIFLASQCLFGTSSGACSAGTASFTNVFLAAAFALLLPYILMMMRAVRSSASPAPGSAETD
jgi:ABC-type transport system involved in cytochrome bd biosynthesis fused ATPase/permease subunit